jgi:glycerol-3-phosphate dehydrogenase subunit C
LEDEKAMVASECPLAGKHVVQGMVALDSDKTKVTRALHPVEILARAYGLVEGEA